MGFDGFTPRVIGAPRRVALTVGGTLGHVHGAIAIAQAYRRHVADADVRLIGPEEESAHGAVRESGFAFTSIPSAPIARQSVFGKLRGLARTATGVARARAELSAHGTQLVIGCGGYASAPTVLAARSLGLPTVLYEANVIPGLANRALRHFARRIYLGWPEARSAFSQLSCEVTGNPLLEELIQSAQRRQERGRLELLVLGGSQGSPFLDDQVPALAGALAAMGLQLRVQHQTGNGDTDGVRARYEAVAVEADVVRHFDDMATAYGGASFAVTCAGAMTLNELASFGVPALVVPLREAAGRHQDANASVFANATGCPVIAEDEWRTEQAARRVAALLTDRPRLQQMSQRVSALCQPEAAGRIVRDCEALLCASPSPSPVQTRRWQGR